MSEILIGSNPDNPQIVGAVNLEDSNEQKAKALPQPSGYHILVAIPEIEKEMELGAQMHQPDLYKNSLASLETIKDKHNKYLSDNKKELKA